MSVPPTPDAPTDATLVAAYRRGDERAATELVRRHGSALGRFLSVDPGAGGCAND